MPATKESYANAVLTRRTAFSYCICMKYKVLLSLIFTVFYRIKGFFLTCPNFFVSQQCASFF